MTSNGTFVTQRREKTLNMSREDTTLGIEGKSLKSPRVPENKDVSPDVKIKVSPPPVSSRPSSSSTSCQIEDMGEPLGTLQLPSDAMNVLETVINLNRTLEHQIDALRLKIDVDARQHESDKRNIIVEKVKVVRSKESEIELLKGTIRDREEKIQELETANEEKDSQIDQKLVEIEDLRSLVDQTEDFANKLSKKVDKLKHEKKNLESDVVYKQQNEEIRRLKHELVSVKDKLSTMERELNRARTIMDQQNTKLKYLELEKNDIHSKFKEELEKATRAMRQEVERMREVMKSQYEEMRNLRQQNSEISSDVRDIKDLLMRNANTPREHERQIIDVNDRIPATSRMTRGAHGGRNIAPPSAKSQVRASMPNMRGSQTNSAFPPISNDNTSGSSKWIPSGNRKSVNAFSAKQKR